jgi:predicted SAM-dependent methyltransferase
MPYVKEAAKRLVKGIIGSIGLEIRKKRSSDDRHLYKALYPVESLKDRRFYTVSSGGHLGFGMDFEHPYWTNIDLLRPIPSHLRQYNPETDISYDMLDETPLPIESGSAEIILSQYSIEHSAESAARFFFADAHRALKDDGILKIVTPNNELDVLAYHNNDRSYFHWNDWKSTDGVYQSLGYASKLTDASLEQVFLAHFAANAAMIHAGGNPNRVGDEEVREVMSTMSTEDALDHFTSRCCPEIQRRFRENHMSWWSPEKLSRELKKVGFKRVNILAPCQSNAQVLRDGVYFDRLWNEVATFVEAVK